MRFIYPLIRFAFLMTWAAVVSAAQFLVDAYLNARWARAPRKGEFVHASTVTKRLADDWEAGTRPPEENDSTWYRVVMNTDGDLEFVESPDPARAPETLGGWVETGLFAGYRKHPFTPEVIVDFGDPEFLKKVGMHLEEG